MIECVGGPFAGLHVIDVGSEFEACHDSDPTKKHLYQKGDDGLYYHKGEGTMAPPPGEQDMAEIYVVTQGEYSDYHILGVYDDQEAAESLVHASKYAEIKVLPLNPGADELRNRLNIFHVYMEANGDNASAEPSHGDVLEEYRVWEKPTKHITAKCWALTPQHAIKIINEKRLIALASPGD